MRAGQAAAHSCCAAGLFRSRQRRGSLAFGNADRVQEHLDARALPRRQLGQMAAEGTRPRPAVVKAEDVPRDIVEPAAIADMPLGVGDELLQWRGAWGRRRIPDRRPSTSASR
jgi:hypothetical protein